VSSTGNVGSLLVKNTNKGVGLDYIHHNPVKGKWSLVDDFAKYPYSSASFYELGKENEMVGLIHYKDAGSISIK
jgi:hypothetical protein